VHALIAFGVNGDGGGEALGLEVASREDGVGWLGFPRSLTDRGLSGVRMVSPTRVAAWSRRSGAALPGAAWQGSACTPEPFDFGSKLNGCHPVGGKRWVSG
jgi:transposase-like protein